MKSQVLDVQSLKKFDEEKRHQETIWSDDHSRISLICMKPGQEIITHTHHGSHIWTVMDELPAFVKFAGPLAVGGPIWTIELTSPRWPK